MRHRFHLRRIVARVLLGLALFGLSGCPQGPAERHSVEIDEPLYRRAKDLAKTSRNQEALASFLELIDQRGGDAPESHFESAEIYLRHYKNPIAAIYHYQRYLEFQPNSPQASLVQQRIETAKREFARTLPAQPFENQFEVLDLREEISRLQRENQDLKAQLDARVVAVVPASPEPRPRAPAAPRREAAENLPEPPASAEPPGLDAGESPAVAHIVEAEPVEEMQPRSEASRPGGRRHVVQRGDTLYLLAQRYYGNRSRWRDIYEANRERIPNQNALALGTSLVIPP